MQHDKNAHFYSCSRNVAGGIPVGKMGGSPGRLAKLSDHGGRLTAEGEMKGKMVGWKPLTFKRNLTRLVSVWA